MMDSSERPHRTSSNSSSTSELFVCFTSRFSSSSTMKISSKSILSPGRARDPPIALSTSLSRRLRTNGSLKGGQSPMFPTGGSGGKKRGCAFENPEPSSPKVTCIGQVRVKTKKQGKRMRTLSKRRGGGGGEASFRKIEQNPNQTTQNNHHQYQQQQQQECLPHRNQRWVHLPLTICEALRAFGAEFSCLFPCRSSCFSTGGREKDEKGTRSSEGNGNNNDNNGQSSCGAMFARWLVALQDGEGGKGREIELVVGGEDDERIESRERTLTRHVVVEEMEIKDDGKLEERDGGAGEEDQEARVSICIPPKNALLLMRCRSDPMRMAALTNRFWESPPKSEEVEEEDVDGDHEVEEEEEDQGHDVEGEVLNGDTMLEDKEVEASEKLVSTEAHEEEEEEEEEENTEPELNSVMGVQEGEERENPEENLEINEELQEGEEEEEEEEEPGVQEVNFEADSEENKVSDSTSEALADPEKVENGADALMLIQEIGKEEEEEEEEEEIVASHPSSSLKSVDSDSENEETETAALTEGATLGGEEEDTEEKSAEEKETQERPLEETLIQETEETQKEAEAVESKERESEVEKKQQEREKSSSVLPDCLLLMMCEPKLSMEVSKETWVCSTDFIRWIPERAPPVNNAAVDGGDDPKKRISTDSNPALPPPLQQPPRSSCSFPEPAAVSMATMIEQKLVNAVAYEPFVLTRCKSEPMRTAAAKLAPDTCFWKNRKLEPLRRATFGLGAAGVGF